MTYDAAAAPPRPCNQTVGLRFDGLDIPRRATIRSAWIQFTAVDTVTNSAPLTLWGVASDSAGVWLSTLFDVSTRLRTSASVAWNPPAWTAGDSLTAQSTPELKAIVQEVVNQSGWLPGHALSFVVTGSGVRNAWSREGDVNKAAILNVDWAAPLSAAADTDGDGMADDWELAHLIGGIAALPGDNDDLDPVNNGDEYIAGTDPRDPLDYPRVSLVQSGGKVVVTYPTLPATGSAYDGVDRFYAVERITALNPIGRWVPGYGASAVPGDGSAQAFTNDLASSNGFYRVKVWLE
jgi:hypothetical protein